MQHSQILQLAMTINYSLPSILTVVLNFLLFRLIVNTRGFPIPLGALRSLWSRRLHQPVNLLVMLLLILLSLWLTILLTQIRPPLTQPLLP